MFSLGNLGSTVLSGAVSGAAGAFAGTLMSTDGDISASLKSTALGAVSGAIGGAGFNMVGTYASFASNPIGNERRGQVLHEHISHPSFTR
jgi:hypothetical protein